LGIYGREFKPPSCGVFSLNYPLVGGVSEGSTAEIRVWNNDIMLLPTYIAPGIEMELVIHDSLQDKSTAQAKRGFVFSEYSRIEIWHIRKNTPVSFNIVGIYEKYQFGVVAVLVY
jgi:hypothetical protein